MSNTTADKLNYLSETKAAIKQAIVDKGVTVDDSTTFRDYADKIGDISGGATGEIEVLKTAPSVLDLKGMITKVDLSNIDVSQVTSLKEAFLNFENLSEIISLEKLKSNHTFPG